MRLQGKLALVTGGSDGIGLGIGEALLREGAELCIVGRNPDKLARARDQLGTEVRRITLVGLGKCRTEGTQFATVETKAARKSRL